MSGDNHTPHKDGRWVFDQSVTDNFDAMLRNSIPEYQTMRDLTFRLGKNYVHSAGNIVDLGASRGDALAPFVDYANSISGTPKLFALELSQPMFEVLKSRFSANPSVTPVHTDLRKVSNTDIGFTPTSNSLVLSILTLQFVPIEHRAKLLRTVYRSLSPGGAIILVEKVLGETAEIDELMVAEYYKIKNEHGYSYEDIQRKRASLEGVLVPLTDKGNRDMLANAGFRQVDCFFRSLNFSGLLGIKDTYE
jgi:tRNA (cmo5U34)-methyltransferase